VSQAKSRVSAGFASRPVRPVWDHGQDPTEKEHAMSKRARKRRSRKGNAANHGKKPNA